MATRRQQRETADRYAARLSRNHLGSRQRRANNLDAKAENPSDPEGPCTV